MKFTCDCINHKSLESESLFSPYAENYCDSELDAITQSIEKAQEICDDSEFYSLEIELFTDDKNPLQDDPEKAITIPIPFDITVYHNSPCGWIANRFQTIEKALEYQTELTQDGYRAEIVFDPAT